MTLTVWHNEARRGALKPREILSRLVVALALVLFGARQSHADGTLPNASLAAQERVEQAQGILSVQLHLLRTQHPDDNAPDLVVPDAPVQTRQLHFAAAITPAPQLSRLPVAIRVLPPVRGPPAV